MIDYLATVFNVPPANAVVGLASLGVLMLTLVGTMTNLILGRISRARRHRRLGPRKTSH